MHTTAYWVKLSRTMSCPPFTVSERQDGMFGLLHALESIACLLLMCDRRTSGRRSERRRGRRRAGPPPAGPGAAAPGSEQEFFEPTLYLYDAYPGGIG